MTITCVLYVNNPAKLKSEPLSLMKKVLLRVIILMYLYSYLHEIRTNLFHLLHVKNHYKCVKDVQKIKTDR